MRLTVSGEARSTSSMASTSGAFAASAARSRLSAMKVRASSCDGVSVSGSTTGESG